MNTREVYAGLYSNIAQSYLKSDIECNHLLMPILKANLNENYFTYK